MNKELLLKVKAEILNQPERFDMSDWHSPCGTTHCIAGWCEVIQKRPYTRNSSAKQSAQADLGLTDDECKRLFFAHNWPNEYSRQYFGQSPKIKAQVATDRIDHFIATEGAE